MRPALVLAAARLIAAIAVIAATAASMIAASTPALATSTPAPSSAPLWQTSSMGVVCGVEIAARGHAATDILCSARGIPRPRHGSGIGDPFVRISASSGPTLVLISQDSFVVSTPTTLAAGAQWSRLGVSCTLTASTARCTNGKMHGFTIGGGSYASF